MNDIVNLVAVVDPAHMAADGYIAIATRRWREATVQVRRRRMYFITQVLVQHSALPQARLLISRQLILAAQASRGMSLVLVVPVIRRLAGVVIELEILTVGIPRLILTASLGTGRAARQHQDYD